MKASYLKAGFVLLLVLLSLVFIVVGGRKETPPPQELTAKEKEFLSAPGAETSRFEKIKIRRQHVAKERVRELFRLAEAKALAGEMDLADRYGQLARKIGMRYNVRMPKGFNLKFCRKCHSYLLPSRNARFRMTGGRLSRQCLNCDAIYRMPLKDRSG